MDKSVKKFIADKELSDEDILNALKIKYENEEAEEQPAEEEDVPEQPKAIEDAPVEKDGELESDPDSKEDLKNMIRSIVGDMVRGKPKSKPKPKPSKAISNDGLWGVLPIKETD